MLYEVPKEKGTGETDDRAWIVRERMGERERRATAIDCNKREDRKAYRVRFAERSTTDARAMKRCDGTRSVWRVDRAANDERQFLCHFLHLLVF